MVASVCCGLDLWLVDWLFIDGGVKDLEQSGGLFGLFPFNFVLTILGSPLLAKGPIFLSFVGLRHELRRWYSSQQL